MRELTEEEELLLSQMRYGTWYRPVELAAGSSNGDVARARRILLQLAELGLVKREPLANHKGRYQYRRTWQMDSSPPQPYRVAKLPPKLRKLGRWLKEWLQVFVP